MVIYNGYITFEEIENTGNGSNDIAILTAKFIHYPDSQQIVLWLPESGYHDYRNFYLYLNDLIWKTGKISAILNGSIQIIFNTITWPEGNYCLEIEHPFNGLHIIRFKKHQEVALEAITKIAKESEISNKNTLWQSFKDSSENIIPNEDELFRNNANRDLIILFNDQIEKPNESIFQVSPSIIATTEILNQALTFATEWGENYFKPILSRMQEKYPELREEEILEIEKYVRKTESYIYELSAKFINGNLNETEIVPTARHKYKWLNHNNAQRLAGIGMYYASK